MCDFQIFKRISRNKRNECQDVPESDCLRAVYGHYEKKKMRVIYLVKDKQ